MKTLQEDIITCYEQAWRSYGSVPSIEQVKDIFIENKSHEMLIDLINYYTSIGSYYDVERLEKTNTLTDCDMRELDFDFDSLVTDIDNILETEKICFVRNKNEKVNNSTIFLFSS